jgi:flagellar hook-basal body protein
MMRSLFSGVSGLKSHQTRMDVIGNNIANVNTTGFKSSRTTFADTLSQTLTGASSPQDGLGGTNPKQIGLGTGVASIDMLFTDGSVQSTGKNTDLCLSGNGLFVVKQGNQTYYTRDGAFAFDADGNYVLPSSGLYVQGWMATDGVLPTTKNESNMTKITIPSDKSMAAKATGTVTYENNLNASVPTIVSITGGSTTKTYMENGASATASTGTPVTLTVKYPDGTTQQLTKTEGTYLVGGTIDREIQTKSSVVTSSDDTDPVSVTLKNGKTYTVSTANANMNYGFTTSKSGENVTASAKQQVTLYYDDNGTTKSIPGAEGLTTGSYTVGGTYQGAEVTTGTVTASTDTPLVLKLDDGTEHTVTSGSYVIGTDTYTYPEQLATGKVNCVEVTKGTVTATADTPLKLKLDDGTEHEVTSGSYDIGTDYTYSTGTAKITSVEATKGTVTASTDTPLTLTLDDGTKHEVMSGSYVIGTDTYTYSTAPATATIKGASQSYTIQKMDVLTLGGGKGTTVRVGGFAEESNLSSATADADMTVYINGSVAKTSGSYKLGETYTGDEITTSGLTSDAATADKGILLYLADGTTATGAIGTAYTIGDGYKYTNAGGTSETTTITGFAYTGTVTSLATRSDIAAIDYVEKGTITQMETPSEGTTASAEKPVTLTLSDGTSVQETTGSYQKGTSLPITTTATIYDSLGEKHEATVFFTKMGVETASDGRATSKWVVSLDLDHTTGGAVSTQTSTDTNGIKTTLTMPVGELVFNSSGAYVSGSGNLQLTLTNGAGSQQTVSVSLSNLTQYASGNTLAGTGDGNAAGTLSSVSIDSSGIITGTYTNGVKQAEAQVAVAQFKNASGLTKMGSSLYQESNNSGTVEFNTASVLGVTITPSALEMSNVDIANEFADMIITQRGFQSNSKIITVGDEMLETLINMKR